MTGDKERRPSQLPKDEKAVALVTGGSTIFEDPANRREGLQPRRQCGSPVGEDLGCEVSFLGVKLARFVRRIEPANDAIRGLFRLID